MPRTLKNNDSLLNFFVGREAFSPVWSEGQVVQMGPGDQASQGGPGGQVVRWSWVKVWEWFLGVSRGLSEVDSPIEVRFKYVLK